MKMKSIFDAFITNDQKYILINKKYHDFPIKADILYKTNNDENGLLWGLVIPQSLPNVTL